MLEERERAYKRELAEGAAEHLGGDEEIRVIALAQTRLHPWLQSVPLGAGVLMVIAGLAGLGAAWVGIVGAVLVLVGIAGMSLVPRRLLVRTDRALYAFELPRSSKAGIEKPLTTVPVAELPERVGGGRRFSLDGMRLWASYGIGSEREAIARALEAQPR